MKVKRSISPLDRSSAPPNPIGFDAVNASSVNEANLPLAPEQVSMKPNDGDNPSIPDAPFADGKDMRNYQGGGSNSDPTPGF